MSPSKSVAVRRSTVYFKTELHRALRLKAVSTQRSLSDLVNDAVQMALREDEEDLAAFECLGSIGNGIEQERLNVPTAAAVRVPLLYSRQR